MEFVHGRGCSSSSSSTAATTAQGGEEILADLRRGPWTVEEDLILANYISNHGEGRWNSLARCAGLKRTGKSCRLRWLNYLRPDVRRGNITPEEQLLILQLHSRWGNRWSKMAQHLPGRTDNEIKNYWRTRVQKHAKQLRCDVNSQQFKDVMRYNWMPRLLERIRAAAAPSSTVVAPDLAPVAAAAPVNGQFMDTKVSLADSMGGSSSDSMGTTTTTSQLSGLTTAGGCYANWAEEIPAAASGCPESLPSPNGYYFNQGFQDFDQNMWGGGDIPENFWSMDDIWSLQQ